MRDAATVVLLRDGDDGVEVWLLTRVVQMAFAGGMSVFPGGRVEPEDAQLPLDGIDPVEVGERFGSDETGARELLGAAARETFEETGVLLSSPPTDLHAAAGDVEAGRIAFGSLLLSNEVAVDGGALRPWARWVTPPGEPRRYDTRFFVAALPAGARAREGSSESTAAGWLTPAEALAQSAAGDRLLMPPTAVTLASLRAFATVADVLAAAADQDLDPVHPEPIVGADGSASVRLPDGTELPLPRRGGGSDAVTDAAGPAPQQP